MLLPVESKQIAYCSYNENESVLHVYYHTGEIIAFPSINKFEFQAIIEATNRYDTLMNITQKGHELTSFRVEWQSMNADTWQNI
ncbi:KTSC domain-containing protein [Paenibacillus nasutitermitis]|uniref:KTSC domain-containing protein n=1 Tax=Paenibacillus nasutitermitis TaxID=1652958 RepID=A0A916YKI3_9BACL|nr:KTSC domain-containing protein [Paenibacillus nasutitermitis]GGD48060.1 hypothetical protein GCM10010911_02000 [Paenibacillus nasutitermitis]